MVASWTTSRLVSEDKKISEVSENRPSEHRVSFLAQDDSNICNLPQYYRNLVELQDEWTWIPGTAVLLATSRPFCMDRRICCLFLYVPPLLIRKFSWVSDGDIFLRSLYLMNNTRGICVPNWCTLPCCLADQKDTMWLLLHRECSVHQMVIWTDVREASRPFASRSCTSRRQQWHSTASAQQLSWSADCAFFHSSYSSFCNSVCFGSVRSRSLMITIQLFSQAQTPENCQYKWILDTLLGVSMFGDFTASPELIWFLHEKLWIFFSHSIVRFSSAWGSRNFRASAYFAIRVFRKMSE